jgi:hypothetical protein
MNGSVGSNKNHLTLFTRMVTVCFSKSRFMNGLYLWRSFMFKSVTIRAVFCALSVLPFAVQAQITITNTDILSLVGKTQTLRDDTTGSVTVNVGAAGANQTWDFRAQVINGENLTTQYLLPQNTPFAAQFPQANFAQKIDFTGLFAGSVYSYSTVAANAWTQVGNVFTSPDTAVADTSNELIVPLPLQFSQTWSATTVDSTGDPATFAIVVKTSSVETVDAWGTIRLPLGDVSCLRIRSNETDITATYFGGMLFQSDTSTAISFTWVTKNHGAVASITSQDGETNPNFTNASSFTLLQSTVTAVDETNAPRGIPSGFMLAQNYPNPFARNVAATTIRFSMPQTAFAELAVFTLQGEQVRVLASQVLTSGTHTFRWDGRDESGRALASGTYVYRLKAGKVQMSRTLLLLK